MLSLPGDQSRNSLKLTVITAIPEEPTFFALLVVNMSSIDNQPQVIEHTEPADAFITFDHNWRYTYVNERAVQLLGRPREDLLGQVVWELFPDTVGELTYREL